MIEKVVSGGQTGVDRAGLDAALQCDIPIGGYPACTERNVVESDGTLILNLGRVSGGTRSPRSAAPVW